MTGPVLIAIIGSILVVAGLAGIVTLLMIQQQSAPEAGPRVPEPPSITAEEDVPRILTEALILAIHMCRADGHITEDEIDAIRTFVVEEGEQTEEWADHQINATLRQTIHGEILDQSIARILRLADATHRVLVLEGLLAIARADADLTDHEHKYFSRVCRRLGYDPTVIAAVHTPVPAPTAETPEG